ncbi:hypothetical protein ABLE92_25465 [Gordonia sp. VNQ95]|uniref:DMP19 family protein n=1 Tax=Gordonia sp. VNQ95 TaxID=3156619 RepID=UPI0032B5BFFE
MNPDERYTASAIVISHKAFDRDDPIRIIGSLIDVTYRLSAAFIGSDQVNPAIAKHIAVDYYVGQVRNGGHAQFLSNAAELDDDVIADAHAGLVAIGHTAALEIWGDLMTADTISSLKSLDDRLYAIADDLERANVDLLCNRPELLVLDDAEIDDYIAARKRATGYDARSAAMKRENPSPEAAAMSRCREVGVEFQGIESERPITIAGESGVECFYRVGGRPDIGGSRRLVWFENGRVEHN